MNNSVLQIRIDEELKNNANIVFEDIGLDLSTAIRIFLNKTVTLNALPFEINKKNNKTNVHNKHVDMEYLKSFMNTEKPIYSKHSIEEYISESRNDRSF